jgi:hypothetical protein
MMEGMSKFQSARSRVFWQEMINHLRGRSAELLSFEDVRARLRLREESYRGIQDVPLDKIAGSVGRYRDFTSSFLPKSDDMRERWSRVYASVNSMQGFEPIELYKIGAVYFVRDGNHRVSVARQLKAKTIEAHVTELPTSIELKPGMSLEELDAAAAYARFLDETGLKNSRPHHQPIQLSKPSRYLDLMGHIYLHAAIEEQVIGEPVSMEDAATHWYDNVFRPAVTLIRKYGVLEDDKEHTEADLYLWLVDHLRDVRAQYGEEAKVRKFSDALVDYLSDRNIPVPEDLIFEADDSVILTRTQIMKRVTREQAGESDDDPDDYEAGK